LRGKIKRLQITNTGSINAILSTYYRGSCAKYPLNSGGRSPSNGLPDLGLNWPFTLAKNRLKWPGQMDQYTNRQSNCSPFALFEEEAKRAKRSKKGKKEMMETLKLFLPFL
jgi:hypothetical protein